MGLFKPKLQKMLERGDVRGLVEALDDYSDQRSATARHYLTLLGERAIPMLLSEISDPPCDPHNLVARSPRAMWSRIALQGMGETAVPHLMETIREGDPQMAEAAAKCLFGIEVGGVSTLRIENIGTKSANAVQEETEPIEVIYPDDVKAAYEQKVGRSFVDARRTCIARVASNANQATDSGGIGSL